mmetsp:Transcript_30860/g.69692  ORF Transcript_30860/g.69692 Transcript_30860/m.69692 type:complete len:301 (-) Transcript_30860:443-1345(-)
MCCPQQLSAQGFAACDKVCCTVRATPGGPLVHLGEWAQRFQMLSPTTSCQPLPSNERSPPECGRVYHCSSAGIAASRPFRSQVDAGCPEQQCAAEGGPCTASSALCQAGRGAHQPRAVTHCSSFAACSSTERLLVPPVESRRSTAASKSHTLMTSASKRECIPCRSSSVRSVRAHPRSSAICTACPATWCVWRKGTPLRTRYSLRSVASMNEFSAARMRAALGVRVASTPLAIWSAASAVSSESKSAALSSCISLLYAVGKPFMVVRRATVWPMARPLLPRSSSSASGFFFCGISDEPVE